MVELQDCAFDDSDVCFDGGGLGFGHLGLGGMSLLPRFDDIDESQTDGDTIKDGKKSSRSKSNKHKRQLS